MDRRAADELARLPFIERVEPYHPSYRLEDELRGWLAQSEANPARPESPRRVNVLAFEWGADALGRVAARAEALGAKVASSPTDGQLVELWVDPDQLRQLVADDDVMWIDRWHAAEADMDLVRQDSGAAFIESNFNQLRAGRARRGDGRGHREHAPGLRRHHPAWQSRLAGQPRHQHLRHRLRQRQPRRRRQRAGPRPSGLPVPGHLRQQQLSRTASPTPSSSRPRPTSPPSRPTPGAAG